MVGFYFFHFRISRTPIILKALILDSTHARAVPSQVGKFFPLECFFIPPPCLFFSSCFYASLSLCPSLGGFILSMRHVYDPRPHINLGNHSCVENNNEFTWVLFNKPNSFPADAIIHGHSGVLSRYDEGYYTAWVWVIWKTIIEYIWIDWLHMCVEVMGALWLLFQAIWCWYG